MCHMAIRKTKHLFSPCVLKKNLISEYQSHLLKDRDGSQMLPDKGVCLTGVSLESVKICLK